MILRYGMFVLALLLVWVSTFGYPDEFSDVTRFGAAFIAVSLLYRILRAHVREYRETRGLF